MLEDFIVIGIVMAITEIAKRAMRQAAVQDELITQVTPLIVLALAGAAQMANAALFAPSIPVQEALKQGLTLGALAGGVFSMGKAILGQS